MSDHDREEHRDKTAPSVGGTGTPIAGSKDGVGEQDPVMHEEAEGKEERPASRSTAQQRPS